VLGFFSTITRLHISFKRSCSSGVILHLHGKRPAYILILTNVSCSVMVCRGGLIPDPTCDEARSVIFLSLTWALFRRRIPRCKLGKGSAYPALLEAAKTLALPSFHQRLPWAALVSGDPWVPLSLLRLS
jgi:hypothetical protein